MKKVIDGRGDAVDAHLPARLEAKRSPLAEKIGEQGAAQDLTALRLVSEPARHDHRRTEMILVLA